MAITTAAAMIGGSLLAAGGSALSASKQASAAKKASQVAADTSLEVADKNNALAREIYGKNEATLKPWQQMGLDAAGSVNTMIDRLPDGTEGVRDELFQRQSSLLDYLPGGSREAEGFGAYKDSTAYNARLDEGLNAVRGGFSGSGALKSGAALKGLARYGQTFASNEFGQFQNSVQNALSGYGQTINSDLAYRNAFINSMLPRLNATTATRDLGFNAASAQTGIATNYSGQIMANNQNAGDAVANAALYRAANTSSPFGNAASMMGGGLMMGGAKGLFGS